MSSGTARGLRMEASHALLDSRASNGGAASPRGNGFRGSQGKDVEMTGMIGGPSSRSGGSGNPGPTASIVQFAASRFYALEDEGIAVLDIIRVGRLDKPCQVVATTIGKSAVGGMKYKEKSEVIRFEAGDMSKTFEVDLIDDDYFDTTLEFEVALSRQEGCEIGYYLSAARVAIIDSDSFPSNEFAADIEEGGEALQKVSVSLLTSYMWFAFWRVPTVWWKTGLIFFLDQLKNVYYLMSIYLKVYLVDSVLADEPAADARPLLVPGSRGATAMLLGVIFVAPNFLLCACDFFKVRYFEIGFFIRKHLRVNLFRKYLSYTDEVRSEVQITEITTAMETDIPDLVSNGYTLLFDLWQGLGKVLCVAVFMLAKDATSALPLLIYPTLMFLWIRKRRDQALALESESGDAQAETLSMVVRLVKRIDVITCYGMREKVVDQFENTLAKQRDLTKRVALFEFFDGQLMSWITIMCNGMYIALVSQAVLAGSVSLGTFLATINVYKDLGDRFDGVYQNITTLLSARDPLIGLTELLAHDTDVLERKEALDARRNNLQFAVNVDSKQSGDGKHGNPFDDLPFSLRNLSVKAGNIPALQDITVMAEQGDFVLITGPHGSGKGTLLDLVAGLRVPDDGFVLTPAHLRVLPVLDKAEVSADDNLFENLTFGAKETSTMRVRTIARRIGIEGWLWDQLENELLAMDRERSAYAAMTDRTPPPSASDGHRRMMDAQGHLRQSEVLKVIDDVENPQNEEDDEAEALCDNGDEGDSKVKGWDRRISRSQAHLIHLARAFIYNPDVMVLHRPVDHMDPDLEERLMKLFREFVDNKGINCEESSVPQYYRNRRPRTIFMSAGNGKGASVARYADRVWELQPDGALECMKRLSQ